MRIAINSLFLIPGKVGGTEIFLRSQIRELAKIDLENQYYIFANNENNNIFVNLPVNFHIIHCRFNATNRGIRLLWEQLILPFQCVYYNIKVLHSPGYTSPIITFCKKITTIFDLNYYFHPEDASLFQNMIYRLLIPLVARTSDLIIVHSNNSKKEMIKVLKINPNKIEVVYPGIAPCFLKKYSKEKIKKVLLSHKINFSYILSSAVSHPHKNLSSLIKAYSELVKENVIKQKLVLLGFAGRDQNNLRRLMYSLKLEKKVEFTGWISQEESAYFFQGADLFVFPSLYEGFGLPLIEAMASGVPLVASMYSCIPEVVKDGGMLVDTKKPEILAQALFKVLRDRKYAQKLTRRGKMRAQFFSWLKFAKGIRNIYTSFV